VSGAAPASDVSGSRLTAVVDHAQLARMRGAWKALAARALEPNVFYDPDFALPAVAALEQTEAFRALLVSTDEPDGRSRLVGIFPFTLSRRWGVPITVGEAFIHPYAMSSAPLVDPDGAGATVAAFLGWLETAGDVPAAWLFRFLPQHGPLQTALAEALAESDTLVRAYAWYDRAVLDSPHLDQKSFEATLSPKRCREYRRLRRKLGEHGAVTVTRAVKPDDVQAAIGEYLALEAAGWKGRRGTAAVLSAETREMFQSIAGGLSQTGQIRVDALRVDGVPAAIAVSCGIKDFWWLWKISFDEDYARYSPGVLAVRDVSEMAVRDGDHYDSCALPGIVMIERLWRQRRPYADMLIVPKRLGALGGAVVGLESLRRQAEMAARRARDVVRGK
jgi:CelD/BcsL family acetyltransferase involved in cellulose biosynthesis